MNEATSAAPSPRSTAPLPPESLVFRVSLADAELFEEVGSRSRDALVAALGSDWSWEGKRVLDFGCGVGRLLRYLTPQAKMARIEGCDMHGESIEWCEANLDPPFSFFLNSPSPPLEGVADETYDLVVAISVFTHLASEWSGWLSELQRVIKPGGLLVTTFHGPGMAEAYQSQSGHLYREDEVGMTSLPTGEEGTFASIYHSRWWIEEHWGRAFEPVSISVDGFAAESGRGHGLFVGSRRERLVEATDLETASSDDPRELAALLREKEINFELAQGFRERADRAELAMARNFALTDAGARKMLFRSMVGGERLRHLGSLLRPKGRHGKS